MLALPWVLSAYSPRAVPIVVGGEAAVRPSPLLRRKKEEPVSR